MALLVGVLAPKIPVSVGAKRSLGASQLQGLAEIGVTTARGVRGSSSVSFHLLLC